jgi:hypothetical protein
MRGDDNRVPVMIMPGSHFHPIPPMMRLVLRTAIDELRARGNWEETNRDKRDCRE